MFPGHLLRAAQLLLQMSFCAFGAHFTPSQGHLVLRAPRASPARLGRICRVWGCIPRVGDREEVLGPRMLRDGWVTGQGPRVLRDGWVTGQGPRMLRVLGHRTGRGAVAEDAQGVWGWRAALHRCRGFLHESGLVLPKHLGKGSTSSRSSDSLFLSLGWVAGLAGLAGLVSGQGTLGVVSVSPPLAQLRSLLWVRSLLCPWCSL